MANNDIDIVITWVDNKDPEWQNDLYKYATEKINFVRYENMETLQYIFRGIELFMPWVKNIHLVTYKHVPSWLNKEHKKLRLISHKDIFKKSDYLPTFNSAAIEMALNNIPNLSERFIYFNDDTFVIRKVNNGRFFENDLPKDYIRISNIFYDGKFSHQIHEMMSIVDKTMGNKKTFILKNFKYFLNLNYNLKHNIQNLSFILTSSIPYLEIYHHPQPHLKSNIDDFKINFHELTDSTLSHRFRQYNDLPHYIFRYWGLLKGNFSPYTPNDARYISITSPKNLENDINSLLKMKNVAFVCFNEQSAFNTENYKKVKFIINKYLSMILPNKSSFEN